MSTKGEMHIITNVLFVKALGKIYQFSLVDIITNILMSRYSFLLQMN